MNGASAPATEDAIDRRPGRASVVLTGTLALVALLPLVLAPTAVVAGGLGTVLLVGGTAVGSDRVATAGLLGLLVGVVLAGLAGVTPGFVLVATAAALVAWDAAVQAIDLGRMLGREASTRRAHTVHVAATAGVAALVSAFGYAAFRVVEGGRPVTALVLLLLGGVVLAATLRA
ncbi:DUF7519 family protein [Halomarina litorea]|uniref:DUF7519 family protein n=1 Tax=Halomarina litorea TaxID=2961595 RepID=UPI0020C2411B|nr:hypothetical protein [Halomarina sp. BCD28]